MANNRDLLAKLVSKETRPLDLGGFADDLSGQILQVWVNAPGIVELLFKQKQNDNYAAHRAVVAILLELDPGEVSAFSDNFMLWLFEQSTQLYTEYHNNLKKKSSAG